MNNKVYQSFGEYFGDYFDLLNDDNIISYRQIINEIIKEQKFTLDVQDKTHLRKILFSFVESINHKMNGENIPLNKDMLPIINLCISCFIIHLFNKSETNYYSFRIKNIPPSRPSERNESFKKLLNRNFEA